MRKIDQQFLVIIYVHLILPALPVTRQIKTIFIYNLKFNTTVPFVQAITGNKSFKLFFTFNMTFVLIELMIENSRK
ncbi:hypothetical protein F5ESL0263_03345 [Lactobacillus sp. ESL0263]|nr:hypothetical protein F5ESL0263_03345 [Lactobacillus sp. ESL0263]